LKDLLKEKTSHNDIRDFKNFFYFFNLIKIAIAKSIKRIPTTISKIFKIVDKLKLDSGNESILLTVVEVVFVDEDEDEDEVVVLVMFVLDEFEDSSSLALSSSTSVFEVFVVLVLLELLVSLLELLLTLVSKSSESVKFKLTA